MSDNRASTRPFLTRQDMKANELMIGDWVYYGNKPVQVIQLSEGKDYKTIRPIPLTPEILEKNGFVMDERDGVAVRYSFAADLHKPKQTVIQFVFYNDGVSADTLFKCWTSPKDCDGINDLHICDLKFVHELQHALRLCGIEKEIVV